MRTQLDLATSVARLESRLDSIDKKLDTLVSSRHKALEWIGQMSAHVESLDAFREEVRASLEPLFVKLEHLDDAMRIFRHATADVGRRVEDLEDKRRLAG